MLPWSFICCFCDRHDEVTNVLAKATEACPTQEAKRDTNSSVQRSPSCTGDADGLRSVQYSAKIHATQHQNVDLSHLPASACFHDQLL